MLLLATDLDGTLLGGHEDEKLKLYKILNENPGIKVVFVTGRGLDSVKPLLEDPIIPNPDFIICDVGATVVDGRTLKPVEPIQSEINDRWPGALKVDLYMKEVPGLRKQLVPMERRCSYYYDEAVDMKMLEENAKELGLDVIVSAGKFIDVLPGGINKGFTLRKLMEMLNVPEGEIIVAGDTLNDLSLFQTGYNGVVVGGAEEVLKEATADQKSVFHATSNGCGGIIEGFRFFGHLEY